MLGSLAGGALQDRLGRRLCLGIGSLCSTVGVAILFASSYSGDACQAVFLVGKLFQGFTIGIVVCTAQTYMSENLPSVLRGPVIAFFPIFFLVGQLTSALIVMAAEDMSGRYSYRICLVSEWPFSAVPLILSLVLPESPVHLIRKGEMDAALKAQRRLDSPKMDSVAKVSRLQALLLHEQKKANGDRSKYIDCFKNTDMRRTMIAVFGAVVPQLFGLPILGDGAYFLQVAGMSSGRSIIFLVVGIVCGLIGNIISLWLLTFVGRRKLILITLAPLILLWLGMGIAGCFSAIAVAW